jgi:hypothetical protein
MNENSKYFVFNKHATVQERYIANIALSHAKYSYEFMVNYEIDELILPRIFLTTFFQTMTLVPKNGDPGCRLEPKNLKTQFNLDYNIYKYAKGLQREHGLNNAYFYFINHQLVSNSDDLYSEIKKAITEKRKFVDYNNTATSTYYRFSIPSQTDLQYLNQMTSIQGHVECINKTYLSKLVNAKRLDAKYTRYFASLNFNNRQGKSIFDTQLAEGVDQHIAVRKKSFARFYQVQPSIAFSSHLSSKDRSSQYMFFAKCPILYEYSIYDLKIDLEYLYFLLSIADRFT